MVWSEFLATFKQSAFWKFAQNGSKPNEGVALFGLTLQDFGWSLSDVGQILHFLICTVEFVCFDSVIQ